MEEEEEEEESSSLSSLLSKDASSDTICFNANGLEGMTTGVLVLVLVLVVEEVVVEPVVFSLSSSEAVILYLVLVKMEDVAVDLLGSFGDTVVDVLVVDIVVGVVATTSGQISKWIGKSPKRTGLTGVRV